VEAGRSGEVRARFELAAAEVLRNVNLPLHLHVTKVKYGRDKPYTSMVSIDSAEPTVRSD